MWTPEQLTQPAPWCSEPLQACPAFVTCSSQAPPALQPGVPGSPVRCPRLSRQVPPALQPGVPGSAAMCPWLSSQASPVLQAGAPSSPARRPGSVPPATQLVCSPAFPSVSGLGPRRTVTSCFSQSCSDSSLDLQFSSFFAHHNPIHSWSMNPVSSRKPAVNVPAGLFL